MVLPHRCTFLGMQGLPLPCGFLIMQFHKGFYLCMKLFVDIFTFLNTNYFGACSREVVRVWELVLDHKGMEYSRDLGVGASRDLAQLVI